MKTLLIRADATAQMGAGHLMRCLALAQAWQEHGGRAVFLSRCEGVSLQRRIMDEGFDFISVPGTEEGIESALLEFESFRSAPGRTWVVLDGYHFDSTHQKRIKEAGWDLLAIDDTGHASHYFADVVLNQNIAALSDLYQSREAGTTLLLGSKYALLRSEFRHGQSAFADVAAVPRRARRILVTLGGSDPNGATLKIIEALKGTGTADLEARILVGPANPRRELIEREAGGLTFPVRIISAAQDMREQLAWADLAVSAGGSTCWEMASMGVPCLLLSLAENQSANVRELGRRGIAVELGEEQRVSAAHITEAILALVSDTDRRAQMSRKARELVDGWGVERVLRALERNPLWLREAQHADSRLIWNWANDPETREGSFQTASIPWEEHARWIDGKLNDPRCAFYIALDPDDRPVGQVRFDATGPEETSPEETSTEATVSISLDPLCRRKGYAPATLRLAASRFFRRSRARLIHAYIKQDNQRSRAAFIRSGFHEAGHTLIQGEPAHHLILDREAVQ